MEVQYVVHTMAISSYAAFYITCYQCGLADSIKGAAWLWWSRITITITMMNIISSNSSK